MKVGGYSGKASTSYTRPANTTPYTAGDSLADSTSAPTALTFANVCKGEGGTGLIIDATCLDSANQSTLPQLTLFLFSGSAAPTATNDNSAIAITDANMANCVGYIEFATFKVSNAGSGADGNAICHVEKTISFECGSTVDDLYGLVRVDNAYTPVSGEAFTFTLKMAKD